VAAYKFQEEVSNRARDFVAGLIATGISASLLEHTFRDYSVKISVTKNKHNYGNIILYYKPSRDSFTLGTHELRDKSIVPEIEDVWFGKKSKQITAPTNDDIHIYVDGSFIDGKIGYGVVILRGDQIIHEASGKMENEKSDVLKMRQVSGEIQAVYEGLAWAQSNGIKSLHIHYDYQGLEFWATGKWRTNNQYTAAYQRHVQNAQIKIVWHKVEGHSGNRWNDRADELARNAAQASDQSEGKNTDPISELIDLAQSFIMLLTEKKIAASFDGIYNNMFVRIALHGGSGKNLLDIYNTKKKPLDPKWHGFEDRRLKKQVEEYWLTFRGLENRLVPTMIGNSIPNSIDYYYNIFKPYRHCDFDFIEFAKALETITTHSEDTFPELEGMRYNFAELEKVYLKLKGIKHG